MIDIRDIIIYNEKMSSLLIHKINPRQNVHSWAQSLVLISIALALSGGMIGYQLMFGAAMPTMLAVVAGCGLISVIFYASYQILRSYKPPWHDPPEAESVPSLTQSEIVTTTPDMPNMQEQPAPATSFIDLGTDCLTMIARHALPSKLGCTNQAMRRIHLAFRDEQRDFYANLAGDLYEKVEKTLFDHYTSAKYQPTKSFHILNTVHIFDCRGETPRVQLRKILDANKTGSLLFGNSEFGFYRLIIAPADLIFADRNDKCPLQDITNTTFSQLVEYDDLDKPPTTVEIRANISTREQNFDIEGDYFGFGERTALANEIMEDQQDRTSMFDHHLMNTLRPLHRNTLSRAYNEYGFKDISFGTPSPNNIPYTVARQKTINLLHPQSGTQIVHPLTTLNFLCLRMMQGVITSWALDCPVSRPGSSLGITPD